MGFLALSLEPAREDVEAAQRKYGLRMTVALPGGGELLAPLGVRGVPSTVFVDRSGRIVAARTGAADRAFFRERANELLAAP